MRRLISCRLGLAVSKFSSHVLSGLGHTLILTKEIHCQTHKIISTMPLIATHGCKYLAVVILRTKHSKTTLVNFSLHCIKTCVHRWLLHGKMTLIEWRNITNAIFYIGLMTRCHKSLHLEKITRWRRLKGAHYASKPFDLLEITITFLRQRRKLW